MNCGFKMANPELASHYDSDGSFTSQKWECEKTNCELWSEHFGRCSFAVDAFIKSVEDERLEKAAERRSRK